MDGCTITSAFALQMFCGSEWLWNCIPTVSADVLTPDDGARPSGVTGTVITTKLLMVSHVFHWLSSLWLPFGDRWHPTVASFTKEVYPRLAKRPLKTNGRLANRGLTSLVKEDTGGYPWLQIWGGFLSALNMVHTLIPIRLLFVLVLVTPRERDNTKWTAVFSSSKSWKRKERPISSAQRAPRVSIDTGWTRPYTWIIAYWGRNEMDNI